MTPNRSVRADVFFAIGDARRRRILEILSEREQTVGALATELEIAQPSVSQHLSVLRDAGLVEATRIGTSSVYRLQPDRLTSVTDWIEALRTSDATG